MEEKINRAIRNLKIQYFALWLLPLLLIVLFETNILSEGVYADNPELQYLWETIGILVVIACVPLSLKLFSFVLKKQIDDLSFLKALSSYELWSGIRLLILGFAVLLNVLIYYFTLNNIGGFCALIGLTASLFCYPSEKRLREELHITND
ncbi:hypothetical protein LJC72_05985 [Bacteroides sp. OttesenSCG-928-D19]|nr:hypothetical protein [Bacteroides sp. OttesenSCG-928-N06]MDL2304876.1 hypothetical protein [Bacteroides sp. OttesenSCG-928-D19]